MAGSPYGKILTMTTWGESHGAGVGVADCVFETTAGLTVVDFKTDRVTAAEASQRAEAYRPQLDAYAGALSRILEKPVTERILYFFACGEEISL